MEANVLIVNSLGLQQRRDIWRRTAYEIPVTEAQAENIFVNYGFDAGHVEKAHIRNHGAAIISPDAGFLKLTPRLL